MLLKKKIVEFFRLKVTLNPISFRLDSKKIILTNQSHFYLFHNNQKNINPIKILDDFYNT